MRSSSSSSNWIEPDVGLVYLYMEIWEVNLTSGWFEDVYEVLISNWKEVVKVVEVFKSNSSWSSYLGKYC